MNYAIITLTKTARDKGIELKNKLGNNAFVYTQEKYANEFTLSFNEKVSSLTKDLYEKYDCLVFIMATGIVVRTIAPLLTHKSNDPAIIVMDEQGMNIISLLSGHIGKANEITNNIAKLLNANPVITTASDVSNKIAVDMIAEQYDALITSFDDATRVTADIVNDELVTIVTDEEINIELPSNVLVNKDIDKAKSIIHITNKTNDTKHCSVSKLIPRNIVVGMGCMRNTTYENLREFLQEEFNKLNLDIRSIKSLCSVSLKSDEEGLIKLTKELNIPFNTYEVKDLIDYEHLFKGSEFVKKTIGIATVAEVCGYVGSNFGQKLLERQAKDGMTISIWQIKKV